MHETRLTLKETARHEASIRASRFVAHAAPVDDEAQARAFLESVCDDSADHNCWAWRLGPRYRFEDDGEHESSAGNPILVAIDGQNIDRAMVVVSRWFGGINLGIGGVIRAYGGMAGICLRRAARAKVSEMATVEFEISYSGMELLRAQMTDWGQEILSEDVGANGGRVRLNLERSRITELEALLARLGCPRGRFRRL